MSGSRRVRVLALGAVTAGAIVAALAGSFATRSSSHVPAQAAKAAAGGSEASAEARFGNGNERGPVSWAAQRAGERAYPAAQVSLSWQQAARETFNRIAARAVRTPNPGIVGSWQPYGPTIASEPGVLNFSGAPFITASRSPGLAISPTCNANFCRLWVGTAGGGVWRTDDALAANPAWTFLNSPELAQHSIGTIVLDPNDFTGQTLYVGTGEPNECSSGCEAGVGVYKSTNGGSSWTKLADACVDNATYQCATPGQDSFLGRGIGAIRIDPTNPSHIFVGSTVALRGMNHVVGGTSQTYFPAGANMYGLYESTNGGATFTQVWADFNSFAGDVFDIELDPLDPRVVYVSGLDNGILRRCPVGGSAACGGEAGADPYDFKQVFAPEAPGFFVDRSHIALTVKNGKTRAYVTDGQVGPDFGLPAASFWRTDNANQPAAALAGSQAGGSTTPAGSGNPFGVVYNGWQRLTSPSTASPYYATYNFCTAQCWYDQDVFTPRSPALPDTVYVIGSYLYPELPCYTKGVGCGTGISNGRAILYSTTAGDPDPNALNRTFTDLSMDGQNVPASWCALPTSSCLVAHHGVHPDQHEIVINPSNPTQIFETSDGGVYRTNGAFTNLSRACFFRGIANPSNGLTTCQRLLSRVPTEAGTINRGLRSLQFIGLAFNPSNPCDVIGGTQDNGTWRADNCDSETWRQTVYGDGGNAGFDARNPTWQFNEFTGPFSDSNFRNGDPEKWVITSAPLVNSNENVAFYWPQIADPNPPLFGGAQTHPIFSGLQHVWRSWAFGAGRPVSVPQQVSPDIAYYEANCPEFTTPGASPNCGDYQPLGGPSGSNTAGDLTGSFYSGGSCSPASSARCGGFISWLARNKADTSTLWAATSAGRLFVSHNANAADPATVTFHRVDNTTSPTRHITSIYPDTNNVNRAFISYSGYNSATPTRPGHVFHVDENGAAPGSGVFTNLNVEGGTGAFPTPLNNGDLPVADVIRDDLTGNLYAATDFGVLRGSPTGPNTYSWGVTPGLPRFEVTHLTPVIGSRDACTANCAHALYAVTHSQGIWVMNLG